MSDFVNLHSHTQGSYLDAIIRVPDLFKRAQELGQKAVSITDHGTMCSIWSAYKTYKEHKDKERPIKLIPGNEIYFCENLEDPKAKRRHLVLLAATHEGYKNLLRITAAGFEKPATAMGKIFPRVDAEILRKYNKGLFATSACGGSIIAAHIFKGERVEALKAAQIFKEIFGNRFFIELQPHTLARGDFNQEFLNEQIKSVAEELGIEMIATCDSHYLTVAHEKYHDMILAISNKKSLDDPDRHRYATFEACIVCRGTGVAAEGSSEVCYECLGAKGKTKPCAEFYIKSEEQVRGFFAKRFGGKFADRLIANTAKIAAACAPPDYMEPKGVRLPKFDMKHIAQASDCSEFEAWLASKPKMQKLAVDWAYLRFKAWKGFKEYTKDFTKEQQEKYWKRVLFEIEILEARDFCSYMLIVSDFMTWARNNNIEVGPGRGSCSASLLGFLLNIHDIDSIKYDLFFERFQNRERKQVPDIDLDISPRYRERVVDYVASKYGRDCVAQISNINTITPKIAIKDITRSLNIGGDKSAAFKIANDITAIIPDKVHIVDDNGVEKIIKVDTMELAIKHSGQELTNFLQQYPEVLDYANHLVGLPRAAGVHAAGVIISDTPLNEYAPMRRDKEGRLVCQLDKDQCEEMGLIKFDFLGLDTLDVLRDAYELAKGIGLILPEPSKIPEGDVNAYNLIKSGKVVGIFQLEGNTLAPLCKPFAPQSVSDIAALSALGRPGCSKEERQDFIDRRFGRKKVVYQHELLQNILKHTYGIKVYDEDLVQMGGLLAGWDLSKSDVLRKITKLKEKGAALVLKTQGEFITDVIKHSKIPKSEAEMLWNDVVLPFSKYNFCRAHATAYGELGYRTAYYKYYAPAAFLAAKLNAETAKSTGTEEDIEIIKKDAKSFGIQITPCDINVSKKYYAIKDRRTIVTGFSAIKGLGEKALESLIQHQPYTSFEDFLHRTPSNAVNKSVVIALAKAGAFDSLDIGRKYAAEHYGEIRKEMLAFQKKNDPVKKKASKKKTAGEKRLAELLKKMDEMDEAGELVPEDLTAEYENLVEAAAISKMEAQAEEELAMAAEKVLRDNQEPVDWSQFRYSGTDHCKDEWSMRDQLIGEKEVLGEYVSGSVDILYPGFFKGGIYAIPFTKIQMMGEKQSYFLEGIIGAVKEMPIKKPGKNQGKIMAKLVVENLKGETVDMTVWADTWVKQKKNLTVGTPIRALTKVNEFNGAKSLILANLEDFYKEKR